MKTNLILRLMLLGALVVYGMSGKAGQGATIQEHTSCTTSY